MRLTPQDAFSIRSIANMLRTYQEQPNAQIEGGFTFRRVIKEAGDLAGIDTLGFRPGDNGLLSLAARLDELADEAMKAPPMSSQEVRAMLRRKGKIS